MDDTPNMAPPPKGDLTNTTYGAMAMSSSLTWAKDLIILFHDCPNNHLDMYVLALFFIFLLAVTFDILSVLPKHRPSTKPYLSLLGQTSVHTFRTGLAYLIMISVMSFNIGILMAALASHGLGFFIVKVRDHGHPRLTRTQNLIYLLVVGQCLGSLLSSFLVGLYNVMSALLLVVVAFFGLRFSLSLLGCVS